MGSLVRTTIGDLLRFVHARRHVEVDAPWPRDQRRGLTSTADQMNVLPPSSFGRDWANYPMLPHARALVKPFGIRGSNQSNAPRSCQSVPRGQVVPIRSCAKSFRSIPFNYFNGWHFGG